MLKTRAGPLCGAMALRAGALQLHNPQLYSRSIGSSRRQPQLCAQQLPLQQAPAVGRLRRAAPSRQGLQQQQQQRRPLTRTRTSQQQQQPSADEQQRSEETLSVSDGEPEASTSSEEEAASASWAAARRQGLPGSNADHSLVEKLAEKPLELASELSKQDAHYLERRNRKRWWSRSEFPRVPPAAEKDKRVDQPRECAAGWQASQLLRGLAGVVLGPGCRCPQWPTSRLHCAVLPSRWCLRAALKAA